MVNPLAGAEARWKSQQEADPVRARLKELETKHCAGWTRIDIDRTSTQGAVMPNEYVTAAVFDWLATTMGEAALVIRGGKYALADRWAYSAGLAIPNKRGTDPGFTQPINHAFFFKDPDDAVLFKLAWK